MVAPKYNPARTFTWEGTVGIGGAYSCIYPMNSPGGYQLVGRTLPIWNSFGKIAPFSADKPWLLNMFDQVRPGLGGGLRRVRLLHELLRPVSSVLHGSLTRCRCVLRSHAAARLCATQVCARPHSQHSS